MTKTCFILMVLGATLAFGAEEAKEAPIAAAVLSPSGIKRIQENIKTLEQNIKDATQNIQTCDKNLKVLQGEMDQVAGLEKEHHDLKQKLNQYLENAQKLMQKNAGESTKLAKAIKETESVRSQDNPGRDRALEKLRQDDSDLTRWKGDADQKVRRIKDMLHEINSDLTDLSGRKGNLKADIGSWNTRRNEYEKLLVDYKKKKSEAERLVKNSNQATQ